MTGPYIVTTKKPRLVAATREKCAELDTASRVAVATLDEAVDLARVQSGYHDGTAMMTEKVAEEGFAFVGPLPDGTVIEVERRPWFKLAIAVDMLSDWQQGADTPHVGMVKQRILDAFNAQEAKQ